MRGNSRVRERFELALDARQVAVVLLGSLVILGGVFVLGVTVGRQGAAAPPAPIAAPKDSLARLDEPLPVREEPPPELKAHQALTDGRAIDKALPVAPVKVTPASPADPPAPAPAPLSVPVPVPVPVPASASVPAPATARPAPPPRTPPPAVASKPSAPKGAYTIQVAASPRRADAERISRQLGARNPRIVEAEVPGKGRWYRVQIGSFETQEAARRQLAALSREGVQGIVTAQR